MKEVTEYLRDSKADMSKLKIGSYADSEWKNAGNQRFLTWGENGRVQDTTYEQYNERITQKASSISTDNFNEFWTQSEGGA